MDKNILLKFMLIYFMGNKMYFKEVDYNTLIYYLLI